VNLKVVRYVLSCPVAAALLAACGASQPPIGAPGAMPLMLLLSDCALD